MSRIERFPSVHPSAVPLFGNLLDSPHSSHETRMEQDKYIQPYRNLGSTKRRSDRKKKIARNNKRALKYRHLPHNMNKMNYKKRESWRVLNENTNMGSKKALKYRNSPQIKEVKSRRGHAHNTKLSRRSDYEHKHLDPRMYDAPTVRPERTKVSKLRSSGHLVRGKQKRKSVKRGRGKSPHRKTPVLYHPTQIGRHRDGALFPQRVPFSVISVQTNPPSDQDFGTPVFDPWAQQGNIHFVEASDRVTPRAAYEIHAERSREAVPEKPTERSTKKDSENKKSLETSQLHHPFSKTFSASFDMNDNDGRSDYVFVRSHDKPPSDLLAQDENLGFSNRVDHNWVDQGYFKYEESEPGNPDYADDNLIEDESDDMTSEEQQYLVIEHDPTKKWYEPILQKQQEEELDLKLADSLPYNVPWRSEDGKIDVKQSAKTAVQIKHGPRPRRHRASLMLPYSGNKFVKVHAVPLSGLSLTDVVREKQANDSRTTSDSPSIGLEIIPKDKHRVQQYQPSLPWFDLKTKDSDSLSIDNNTEALRKTDNGHPIVEITMPLREHEMRNVSSRGHGQGLRKKGSRRVKIQTKSVTYGQQNFSSQGENASLEQDGKEMMENGSSNLSPTVATDKPRQDTYMNSPFSHQVENKSPNSDHNKDVWWEFPKIEKYQAVASTERKRLPRPNNLVEFEPSVNIGNHDMSNSTPTTEASLFYASMPTLELRDTEKLAINDTKRKERIDNQTASSSSLKVYNLSAPCDSEDDCEDLTRRGENQTKSLLNSTSSGQHLGNLLNLPAVDENKANNSRHGNLSTLQNETETFYANKEPSGSSHKKPPNRKCNNGRDKSDDNEISSTNSTDLYSSDNFSECNLTEDVQFIHANHENQIINETLISQSLPINSLPDSSQNATSRRRKAGRRHPQPQAYHNLAVRRSPFKPPLRASLYRNSPASRPRPETRRDGREDTRAEAAQRHRTRKLHRLRQLLQNSSVVEQLKSKLDKLHQNTRVTPMPPGKLSAVPMTSHVTHRLDTTGIPFVVTVTHRRQPSPWYELSTGSDDDESPTEEYPPSYIETVEETEDTDTIIDDSKEKVGNPDKYWLRFRENRETLQNVADMPLNRQHSHILRPDSELNHSNRENSPRYLPQDANQRRTRYFTDPVARAWWDLKSDGHQSAETDTQRSVEEVHNIKLTKRKRKDPEPMAVNFISRRRGAISKKDATPFQRPAVNTHQYSDNKPRNSSTASRDEPKLNSVKLVRARSKPTTAQPPSHELYRANYPSPEDKTSDFLNDSNVLNDSNQTTTERMTLHSATPASPISPDSTPTLSTPKRRRAKSPTRLKSQKREKSRNSIHGGETSYSVDRDETMTDPASGQDMESNSTQDLPSPTPAWVTQGEQLSEENVAQPRRYPEAETYRVSHVTNTSISFGGKRPAILFLTEKGG